VLDFVALLVPESFLGETEGGSVRREEMKVSGEELFM
jgi:hypothetical protein